MLSFFKATALNFSPDPSSSANKDPGEGDKGKQAGPLFSPDTHCSVKKLEISVCFENSTKDRPCLTSWKVHTGSRPLPRNWLHPSPRI